MEWRKIEDELPEHMKYVWCYSEAGKIFVSLYNNCYEGEDVGFWANGKLRDDVTHWMPYTRPQPPTN